MNVLVLHNLGDPAYWREAVRSLEFMVPECRPEFNCVIHNASLSFPDYLKKADFHLILLGPTFLWYRNSPQQFKKILKEYNFIKDSLACKVALPQDDYDCSAILDEWMVKWKIDRVYSVCSENINVLYPKYFDFGEIKLGYTGYISEEWITTWKNPKPHSERLIDVSYRTHSSGKMYCSLRYLKYIISERFINAVNNERGTENLLLDISSESSDLIPGNRWHRFIENSKFCLTTPSGSSLLDKYGYYHRDIIKYVNKYPKASFEDVREYIYREDDNKYLFTAISPRNIEAALSETVQIATPGTYSNLMKPEKHYIPLQEDCSNIKDVLKMMKDETLINSIKINCKKEILNEKRLLRKNIVNEITQFAEVCSYRNKTNGDVQQRSLKAINRYNDEIGQKEKVFWMKKRAIEKTKHVAIKLGVKKVVKIFS